MVTLHNLKEEKADGWKLNWSFYRDSLMAGLIVAGYDKVNGGQVKPTYFYLYIIHFQVRCFLLNLACRTAFKEIPTK